MGLALFQLNVSRKTGTHFLIAYILLGFLFLVNCEVGSPDWSMALVIIHRMRVRRRLRVSLGTDGVVHNLLAATFTILVPKCSPWLLRHKVGHMGTHLLGLAHFGLVLVRVFE